jgi:hypothetical protein
MSPVRNRSAQARKGAGFTAFTGEDRNTGTGWLRSQSPANPSPKSLNSLLTGKLTGKNIESGYLRPGGAANPLSGQRLTAIFPFSLLNPNREFFSTNREIFPVNRETAARYHGINDFPAFPGFWSGQPLRS